MSGNTVNIVVFGACGRMGRFVCELAHSLAQFNLVAAVEHPAHKSVGSNLFGVEVRSELPDELPENSVGVCFTNADGIEERIDEAGRALLPMVVGTTGLSQRQRNALVETAKTIPIVYAPNFSLGVNVLLLLAEHAAKLLPSFEAEVFEAHHSAKRDAPSGTALEIGKAVATARGLSFDEVAVMGRSAGKARNNSKEIGFSVMRAGDVVGEHELVLFGRFERLYIGHKAHSRAVFAQGALAAAKWIVGKPAGLYSMKDVLGL